MAKSKTKKLTPVQQEYQQMALRRQPARPIVMNSLRAFLVGGLICVLGQAIQDAFIHWGGMTLKEAAAPTVAVLIIASVILTALGVYDKLGQWAGAGSAVPVTGFANAMASAAIEHRAEGIVLGAAANMFKLAGSVIVFGTVAAFVIALIRLLYDYGSR